MKSRTGQKLKLTTVEQLLGVPNEEISTKIEIEKIYEFENHPFKVIDEKKEDLVESIRDNGVLSPVLVRPDDEDGYEMVSGHRRMHAAKRAGLVAIFFKKQSRGLFSVIHKIRRGDEKLWQELSKLLDFQRRQ